MEPINDRRIPTLSYQRLRAVLAVRGVSLEAFSRSLSKPISSRYLAGICVGERRPSVQLVAAIVDALGPEAWPFVTGATDTLVAPPLLGEGRR